MSFKDRTILKFISIRENRKFQLTFTLLIVLAMLYAMIWAGLEEQKKWKKFSAENNCKLVEHHEPKTSTAFINGEFSYITTPAEDVYECNGMRFTR